jgi:hypothetical protein
MMSQLGVFTNFPVNLYIQQYVVINSWHEEKKVSIWLRKQKLYKNNCEQNIFYEQRLAYMWLGFSLNSSPFYIWFLQNTSKFMY